MKITVAAIPIFAAMSVASFVAGMHAQVSPQGLDSGWYIFLYGGAILFLISSALTVLTSVSD